MNRSFVTLLVLGLIAFSGCNKGTPGGQGATDPGARKSFYGQADNTFNLSVPSSLPLGATTLKQGQTAMVSIGINRGKDFDQDVTLKCEGLPTGVTVDPASPEIKRGETAVKLTLKAVDNAALGDFTVKVTGHPTSGADATNEFKLTVTKNATFTLSIPHLASAIKQGDTTGFSIGIKREMSFDQDVTITFAGMPKGVTLEPASLVLKHGDTEAKCTLKVADDAAVGDFAIMLTGHPLTGADASHEFKFTVTKK